ncbi:MAG TPA: PQQ-binding-like beta-propeller repeat protein [Planctomycetota bacterium]
MALLLCLMACQEWTQDAHDAQRTGYTAEEPVLPWTLAWTWNGPDAAGGTGGHRYHQPAPYTPWEARTCTGGAHVYVPGNADGLYALKKSDGSVAWRMSTAPVNVTPAYDPATRTVYAGSDAGTLVKLNADTGAPLGTYDAGAKIVKSVMLAGSHAYVLTAAGTLHKVSTSSMTAAWTYAAGAAPHTLPAYSSSRRAVIFCTADLQVHAVNDADGTSKWKVRPSPLAPGTHVEFQGGWPVIAELRGIVFVRMMIGDVSAVLWSGGPKWGTTNAAIRARLQANPGLKNLFALSLDTGAEAFVPAVGPAGVEDLLQGRPRLRVHSFPVVRVVDGKEVAYSAWRNGDTRDPKWDARWDSHLGEMALDGPDAGDLRFVKFEEHDHWLRITDEACPLTMAGETLFHAHWDASEAARITDRSAGLGATRANPIQTVKLPSVVRHVAAAGTSRDTTTHWTATGMKLVDGRWKAAPGWWVYWNILDPPTPARDAYSEGILPRYTYVSDGLVIVEGNGGDLFVLRHSGPKR